MATTSTSTTTLANADNTEAARVAGILIFDKYCLSKELPNFEVITKEEFEKESLISEYANYLVNVHTYGNDEKLMYRTCDEYIRRIMNSGKAKFGNSNSFYDVLDPLHPKNNWFSKLRKNITRRPRGLTGQQHLQLTRLV